MAIYNLDSSVNPAQLTAGLATKQSIGFNPTAAPNSALQLSYFGNFGGVIVNSNANFAFTFNDDLKTGQTYKVILTNTHVSTTISASFPVGTKGHPFPAYIVAAKFIELSIQWTGSYWLVLYTGVLA